MFAGRYLWWNAVAAMAQVFCSFYFYYLSWIVLSLNGCAKSIGPCAPLANWMDDVVRPYGMAACAAIVVVTGVMRIFWLRMNPLWVMPFLVWFGATADYLRKIGDLWLVHHLGFTSIMSLMPLEALFFAGLVAYMCFPVENYCRSDAGGLKAIYYLVGLVVAYSVLVTVAHSTQAAELLRLVTGSTTLAGQFAALQPKVAALLSFGQNGALAQMIAFAVFVGAIVYLTAIQTRPLRGTHAAA